MTTWKRKRPRRTKPYLKRKFLVWPERMQSTIQCPRCRRDVGSDEAGRIAHRVSCVRIPANLPKGWGRKMQ